MVSKIFITAIEFYQRYLSFDRGVLRLFAPGGACRYRPTCSEYTRLAIQKYGAWQGLLLGARRIWSCR